MLKNEFETWLNEAGYVPATVTGTLSRAERIEEVFGDLDMICQDGPIGVNNVISAMMYTREDEKNNAPAPAGFIIQKGETPYKVMGDLRWTMRRYSEFYNGVDPKKKAQAKAAKKKGATS